MEESTPCYIVEPNYVDIRNGANISLHRVIGRLEWEMSHGQKFSRGPKHDNAAACMSGLKGAI